MDKPVNRRIRRALRSTERAFLEGALETRCLQCGRLLRSLDACPPSNSHLDEFLAQRVSSPGMLPGQEFARVLKLLESRSA